MPNPVERIADELLVMDAQMGDRCAFDTLVTRWQRRLWRHAFNLTGVKGPAWDISQESWLEILRGLTRLNEPAKFGAWAYRIVSHKVYDWRRRNLRERSIQVGPEETPVVISERAECETATDVHGVLRQLSRPAQMVLNLCYLEGFSLAEIAGILGLPEGTVKSRLHAARNEFRNHWEALGRKEIRHE
jgi:RNA polymerase sigma-70 factor, ECF subfamily